MIEDFHEIILRARRGEKGQVASLLQKILPELAQFFTQSKNAQSLETLLAMQEQEDWVAFADVLEYEILPQLGFNQ